MGATRKPIGARFWGVSGYLLQLLFRLLTQPIADMLLLGRLTPIELAARTDENQPFQ
jgi:hypothetical protein